MRYRVIRDIGSADYPVGAAIEGDSLDDRRLRLLIEQRRLEVIEPAPSELAADQARRLAELEAHVAILTSRNAELESRLGAPSELAALTVVELRSLAAAAGIAAGGMKKDDLIAALTAGEEASDAN